ncbi:MAG TPA: PaaI family thioesterase [Rhizobiaceae bacterium]|nr:PaaI family thioesterase [Rhizobiaceae bacterium]
MSALETAAATRREALLASPVALWLQATTTDRANVYRLGFVERHIGNPFVRALHGGVVGSMAELSALLELARLSPGVEAEVVSSSIDYMRVTKDIDLFARVDVVRLARRLAFLDVWCWQDDENAPVARASCTVRLFAD